MDNQPHAWLRGPVDGVPRELQPVAHALIQTSEDAREFTDGFPDELLWEPVAGLAPVGFHLKHIAGVIDRLTTTAEKGFTTDEQRAAARAEREPGPADATTASLVQSVERTVEEAIGRLRRIDTGTLYEPREVGRLKLPSTVIGNLFHAAEHAQRHCGQLLVTSRVVRERAGR